MSRLVGTLRGIQSLCKWLSQIWRFLVRVSSRLSWFANIMKAITGTSTDDLSGLRLILLTPSDGRQGSLADFLFGSETSTKTPMGHLLESTKRTIVLNSCKIPVIDAPALPGPSLDNKSRAREALRSLQLSSPGPHAFLLEIPVSSMGLRLDFSQAIELFGEEVTEHILPVVTYTHHLGRRRIEQLLHPQSGNSKKSALLCDPRPELVNISPDRSVEDLAAARIRLMRRVMELKKLRGHFVHEMQRREERFREELLTDMASVLATKLGHME